MAEEFNYYPSSHTGLEVDEAVDNLYNIKALVEVNALPATPDAKCLYKLLVEIPGRTVNVNNYYGLGASSSGYSITQDGLVRNGAVAYTYTSIYNNLNSLVNTGVLKIDSSGMICLATVNGVQGCYYKPNTPTKVDPYYKGLYQYQDNKWSFLEKSAYVTNAEWQSLTPQSGITYYIEQYDDGTGITKNVVYKNGKFFAGSANVYADISQIDYGVANDGKTIYINGGKATFRKLFAWEEKTMAEYQALGDKSGTYVITDALADKYTEIDDSVGQKYSTTKTSSNKVINGELDKINNKVQISSRQFKFRGRCNVNSESTIQQELTQKIATMYGGRSPENGEFFTVYLKNSGNVYVPYKDMVYCEESSSWAETIDRRDFDLTNEMLSNTYNVANVNFESGTVNCLEQVGSRFQLVVEATLKTPITDVGQKNKLLELPIRIGGSKVVSGVIERLAEETKTYLIPEWFQAGGSHYVNPQQWNNLTCRFRSVILEHGSEGDIVGVYGTQKLDALGNPMFDTNGMPQMEMEEKSINSNTTGTGVGIYEVLKDSEGNPVAMTNQKDKNGNQAWVLRFKRILVDKEYLYHRALAINGCPINTTGRVGNWYFYDDGISVCMAYNSAGQLVDGALYVNGEYEFKTSYAMSVVTGGVFFIEDNADGLTCSIKKSTADTCKAFSLACIL